MTRSIFAEALGTALLLAIVVGSGVMGETISDGDAAMALLGNTLATAAGLIVLILIFGDISGAHFNPAVTAAIALRGRISPTDAAAYIAAQIVGAIFGVLLAHAMFNLDLLQTSARERDGVGQMIGEATAAFGLVLTIFGCARHQPQATPYAVGLFIAAGYWFTSSTSFANPAVTIARTLTDTFSGIRPADAPAFIAAQFIGMSAAAAASRYLYPESKMPA